MKSSLVHWLRCPHCKTDQCKAELSLADADQSHDEIESGVLNCAECKARHPIVAGIPRFVPLDNYADNFGFQWNRFRKTQLDSHSRQSISRDRFLKSTGWTPDSLAGKAVLDIGCGAGRFVEVALSCGAIVFAVDYSGAVDACRANFSGHPNLHVIQADVYALPFADECVPLYAEHVLRVVGALRGRSRKVLVVDLDNTLWGGVVGEDGIDGIRLGQGDPRGEAFLSVQRAVLALKQRGVLLAVCSKNDEQVARKAIREHPEMLLRESDFSAFQINWTDKATNLQILAEGLSLGLDSFVFLDDNPFERAQVREFAPQVMVLELLSDPATYASVLMTAGLFEAVTFSQEDRTRVEQYAANTRRDSLRAQSCDLGAFLRSLGMEAIFTTGGEAGWPRFAQLINKSNQFNLTTRRYTETEIAALVADPATLTLQVRLVDQFGDNGMISAIIAVPAADAWVLDTWVMSCRVLGREVEHAVLNQIAAEARARGIRRLIGVYRPTERNGMVREHYAKLGFVCVAATEGEDRWVLELAQFTARDVPITITSNLVPA